ncbi:glycosyltransferase family 2 protein [Notoacmeibacter sp. MSK16QG-6]|uniref:glycosyltransferase family 2 protein n=1 Tax=Notoacmeibacter sp. MSK16QG-6 TaxID=2957982 RepID=UPI0020A018E0|nr:glycosyltransferase [Notoacmeibacter sp. MSK16QG-6]MCP1198561.1 glycosyltransferase [Notoacmeibacter sp. MSK16QG-6]
MDQNGVLKDEENVPPVSTILTRSPDLNVEAPEVIVTVPTYKRPDHLLKTLQSLRDQKTSRRYAVIVMENEDDKREGAHAAAPLFESGSLTGLIIAAHRRGNCEAYNAGWQTALDTFPNFRHLLVIDDDEIAEPRWLARMCGTAETLEVDIVGGPQNPVFEKDEYKIWSRHPVFRPPYTETGPVPALYSTGNLLMKRPVLEHFSPTFLDLRFNFMGGGDSDFLMRARKSGYDFGWCAEATVHETIPSRRLQADWIRTRSLRNGVISTLVDHERRKGHAFARGRVLMKSLALLAASPARGLKAGLAARSLSVGLYPVLVGAGRVLGEFGYMNDQYRQAEKN